MQRLSKREKLVLIQVIKSCEKYSLNENESMRSIRKLFDRSISRRTYYYYKHKIYEKLLGKKIHGRFNKNNGFFNILRLNDLATIIPVDNNKISKDAESQILTDYWVHNEFFGSNEIPKFYQRLYAHSDSVIQQSINFLDRLGSQKLTSIKNSKSIPSNATIREEYVKCGKYYCFRCPHGPYYYAYWKDENGKLKKEYIGSKFDDSWKEPIWEIKPSNYMRVISGMRLFVCVKTWTYI